MVTKTKDNYIEVNRYANAAHYESSLIKDLKNLNEIYRYVFFKDKKFHLAQNRAEFIYLDLCVDDIEQHADAWENYLRCKDDYTLIKRFRCTGLRDKTGALIFEGDIVRYKIGSQPTTACIVYLDASAGWNKGSCAAESYLKSTVIIGDIIQNPELDYYAKEHLEEFGIKEIKDKREYGY